MELYYQRNNHIFKFKELWGFFKFFNAFKMGGKYLGMSGCVFIGSLLSLCGPI